MTYYVGIDGGGTGTKVSLADEKHCIVYQFSAGAFNLNGQTREKTHATIREITETLKEKNYQVEDCLGIGIGSAGISNLEVGRFLRETFRQEGFRGRMELFGDHQTAMAAACPECHGIVLIAGTGSICCGIDTTGKEARSGGWGHIIDDGGSGYAIGRDILTAVVRAYDGRDKKTALSDAVFHKLGISCIEDLIHYIYEPGRSKKEIGGLAVLLGEYAEVGDKKAMEIEGNCADSLAELVAAVYRKMPDEKNVVFAGSVLEKNKRIREQVAERIQKFVKNYDDSGEEPVIRVFGGDASIGALRLLWRREGANNG